MGKECFQLLFSKVQVLFVWFFIELAGSQRRKLFCFKEDYNGVPDLSDLPPARNFELPILKKQLFQLSNAYLNLNTLDIQMGVKCILGLYLYLKFLLKRRTVPNSNCFKRVFYNRALDAVWLPVNALKISRRRGNIILLVMCVTHHAWYYVQVVLHIV